MLVLFWQTHRTWRGALRAPFVPVALAVLTCLCAANGASAEAVVGIFSQPSGTGCTLSDSGPGFIDGYVVVRPTTDGVSGVQFSAPLPGCFTGTFVADQQVPGTLVIGDSQAGISISLTGCSITPTHVLTIRAFGYGTTPACCAYPVLPDPVVSSVLVVDCFYQEEAASAVVSVINANSSCPCSDNLPPLAPHSPTPFNYAVNVPVGQTLSWSGEDPDGTVLTYDVYFGTSPSPPLVASDLENAAYAPTLDYDTAYYWQIVARDAGGATTPGEAWTFHTRPANSPPGAPRNPIPATGASGQQVDLSIEWTATDIDGDVLTYDVYFGDTSPPPLVSSGQLPNSYTPETLAFSTTYHWRVVAHDPAGHETGGPQWSFSTRPVSFPPYAPTMPTPLNGAVNQVLSLTLRWVAGDPDNDPLVFDVYFGTTSPPALVASGVQSASYPVSGLSYATPYYWKVVARDPYGLTATSSLWHFTTRPSNFPPDAPTNPVPANGSNNRLISQVLSWTCTDPDGDALVYDLRFGNQNPPPLVASGLASPSFDPDLAPNVIYYWSVVARDPAGATHASSTWNFRTKANAAPNPPTSPVPAHAGKVIDAAVLSWFANDPDGDPLTYDVYFGDNPDPPQVASGLTQRSHALPGLEPETRYYWWVLASDGNLTRASSVWYFDTVLGGDVNADGSVTIADASCAFRMSLYDFACVGSAGQAGVAAADVDCGGDITPRDARCIHKHALDGTCSFCGGDGGALAPAASSPVVTRGSTWEDHDTLVVELKVSGVPSFESFWFEVEAGTYGYPFPALVRVARRGVTNGWEEVDGVGTSGYAFVGGYTTGAGNAAGEIPFIRLRFLIPPGGVHAMIGNFRDDLEGAQPVAIDVGGDVPVLIASFAAGVVDAGVSLRWTLAGDESAEHFTILRRAGSEPARVSGEGAVTSSQGSFLDSDVAAATTYHYELVVRTADGSEFRSPAVTVTTPAVDLVLGQNHPNPFNPTTVIPYTLANGSAPAVRVRLLILDVSGAVVRTLFDGDQSGGHHEVVWDGRDDRGGPASSGVYFYVLDAGAERRTRKLVLLK